MSFVVAVEGLGRVSVPDLPSACSMLGGLAGGRAGAVWRVLEDRAVRVATVEAIGERYDGEGIEG